MVRILRYAAAALVGSCLLAGCGSGEVKQTSALMDPDADPDSGEMGMSLEQAAFVGACNEARGALYRLGEMAKGEQPIHVSDLGHGAGYMRTLAENRKASAAIFRSVDEWRAAVVAHSQEITSLPPRIENGRVIEPDTADMDRRLLERVKPQGVALYPWVLEVCGDVEDPFA